MQREDVMQYRVAGLPGEVGADLDKLSTGVLQWVVRNMEFLDLESPADLPKTPRVKAILELSHFCGIWARVRPVDSRRERATEFVRRIWESPDFAQQVVADPKWAAQGRLIYGAVVPPGVTKEFHRAGLAELAATGYLAPRKKKPYLQLETRYFADLAGVDHQLDSYADLYATSLLGGLKTAWPLSNHDTYAVTHTAFYLTDFGFRDSGLAAEERARALRIVCELTERHLHLDNWELAAELALAQLCLGGDPANTPSGARAIRRLREVQRDDGVIPGRSTQELRVRPTATPVEFFRRAYHPTLVAGLVSLILPSAYKNS